MASTTKSACFYLALLVILLASTPPKANAGLIVHGISVAGMEIGGIAHCSSTITSPCTTCAPISGLLVSLELRGNILAAVHTLPDGSFRFRINVPNIITGLSDLDSLRVFTSVPISGCPIWASVTTGILEGVPIVDQEAGGIKILDNILYLIVPALHLVS